MTARTSAGISAGQQGPPAGASAAKDDAPSASGLVSPACGGLGGRPVTGCSSDAARE
jgi:hypothetical protein